MPVFEYCVQIRPSLRQSMCWHFGPSVSCCQCAQCSMRNFEMSGDNFCDLDITWSSYSFESILSHNDVQWFRITELYLASTVNTESCQYCQLCRYWWHMRLSLWQTLAKPAPTKLASWYDWGLHKITAFWNVVIVTIFCHWSLLLGLPMHTTFLPPR